MSIITSLIDTDKYKFSVSYYAIKTSERMKIDMPYVQYRFKCRNDINLLPYKDEIIKEIKKYQQLELTLKEKKYIAELYDPEFADTISEADLNDVNVMVYEKDKELHIDVEGKWHLATFFEIPILSIVNEVYFRNQRISKTEAEDKLKTFITDCTDGNIRFSDFGTRRRYSKVWQEHCIREAIKAKVLTGTSNLYFANKFKIESIGSQPHEFLMAHQVLSSKLRDFQIDAFNHWLLTFRGKFNTALTDCVGIDNFLNDWDDFFKTNYTVLRHDSGSPFEFIDKVTKEYLKYNYELPTLLFSDGLTPELCKEIKDYQNENWYVLKPRKIFGIGTNFTNNVGLEPLQIVMKLTKVNGSPVAKISDSKGKGMCEDKVFEKRLKQTFGIKE